MIKRFYTINYKKRLLVSFSTLFLIGILYLFYTKFSYSVNTAPPVGSCMEEVCTDTPIRICKDPKGPCIDDWKVTCRLVNVCPPRYIPPPVPPVTLPPQRPAPVPTPPRSVPTDQLTPTIEVPTPTITEIIDYCPCGRDGVGNCNWGGELCNPGGGDPVCYPEAGILWMRIVSNDNGKTVAWKDWNNMNPDVVTNFDKKANILKGIEEIKWSTNRIRNLPVTESQIIQAGADGSKTYRIILTDSSFLVKTTPFGVADIIWESDPLGVDRAYGTYNVVKNGFEKTFDISRNRVADDMNINIYGVDPNTGDIRKDILQSPWSYGPWYIWSNHFCGRGLLNDLEGSYPKGDNEGVYCDRTSADEGSRKFCDNDYDGCRGFFVNSKCDDDDCTDYGNFPQLDSLLRFADSGSWVDLRYDEYWSFNARILKTIPNSDLGSMCEKVENIIELKPPAGYDCKDFKLYTQSKNGGPIDATNLKETYEVDGQPQEFNQNYIEYSSDDSTTCKLHYKPSNFNLLLFEIQPKTGCDIQANVTCSGAVAEVQYTASNVVGGVPVNASINLNEDPFSDWYNDSNDWKYTETGNDFMGKTVSGPIIEGITYEASVTLNKPDGAGGFVAMCTSATIPFSCQPERPDYCSNVRIVNHDFEVKFDVLASTSEPVKEVHYLIYNTENLDENGNPKPVCVSGINTLQGDCPAGYTELAFSKTFDTAQTSLSETFNYESVFINDANWDNQKVKKILIKTFFKKDDSNPLFSRENQRCNIQIEKYEEPEIDPTCQVPDTQTNPDSTGCANVLYPLIQHTTGNPDDEYTLMNLMRGIDPTLKAKFNWSDSVPPNDSSCPVIYMLNIYETNEDGTYEGMNVLKQDTGASSFVLDPNILDFGKNYKWNITANIVQKNSCSMTNPKSIDYYFSTNSFPEYIRSGFSFNPILPIPVDSFFADTPGNGVSTCSGNVNCTDNTSTKGEIWGGNMCYAGNPEYIDTQPSTPNSTVPQNTLYYWFDYYDNENYYNNTCRINEMLTHRIAFIKQGSYPDIKSDDLSISAALNELKNASDIFFEFNVSSAYPERATTFSNEYADIEAVRYFDTYNNMRIIYKITFKETLSYKNYEIFASMVGTAMDPRGESIYSSILMYDIPDAWDNTGQIEGDEELTPYVCNLSDEEDEECGCPGACCDQVAPGPEPSPKPKPQDPPKPKPTSQPVRPPKSYGGGGGGRIYHMM